jgi:nucleoside-diphosphate-sugar epimerase
MKRAIVTGAAGFVGSSVVNKLVSNGVEVLAIDIAEKFRYSMVTDANNFAYKPCDISDLKKMVTILEGFQADTFYHFAWNGSAGPLRESVDIQISNALLTIEMIKLAHEHGCKKFVCSGTIMEYELDSLTYGQYTSPSLSHIYAMGKQLAHSLGKAISNKIGIDFVWAYITNAYGVGEFSPRLINTTIRKIIDGHDLHFTSGTQNYDFIYIDDVAQAFYLLGDKGIHNCGYLIGSGNPAPLRSFLERIVKTCGKETPSHFGDLPFSGINLPINVYSIEKLQEDTGFAPQISFEEGITRTYKWMMGRGND